MLATGCVLANLFIHRNLLHNGASIYNLSSISLHECVGKHSESSNSSTLTPSAHASKGSLSSIVPWRSCPAEDRAAFSASALSSGALSSLNYLHNRNKDGFWMDAKCVMPQMLQQAQRLHCCCLLQPQWITSGIEQIADAAACCMTKTKLHLNKCYILRFYSRQSSGSRPLPVVWRSLKDCLTWFFRLILAIWCHLPRGFCHCSSLMTFNLSPWMHVLFRSLWHLCVLKNQQGHDGHVDRYHNSWCNMISYNTIYAHVIV